MPRPLVLANKNLCVMFDARYRVRDLFSPTPGIANHASDGSLRTGIWIDGRLSWFDWDEWNVEFDLDPSSGIGKVTLECAALGIVVETREWLQHGLWLREYTVRNLQPTPRDARLFWTQYLTIAESDIGVCACYRPDMDAVVHYRGEYAFAFGAVGMKHWTAGIHGFGNLEGTWRDAEDGELSQNPIAQGSVDSTIGVDLALPASGVAHARAWMAASSSMVHLATLVKQIPKAFDHPEPQGVGNVPQGEFAAQVLHAMVSHVNGAVIASMDSDIMETNRANYSYCWLRDASLVACLLARLGRTEEADGFFDYLARLGDPPYLQKYDANGRLGASWHPWIRHGRFQVPIQLDETALPLVAMAARLEAGGIRSDDLAGYARLAKFLVDHRDPTTGLPSPGYALWEERFGTHTYTVATVVAGLRAAAKIARHFGEQPDVYEAAAESILAAMRAQLVDPLSGTFARGLDEEGNLDATPDASLLLLPLLGVVAADDPTMMRTVQRLEGKLWVHSPVGGMARYPGDYYFRQTEAYPGNPWVICTMWLAQVLCLQAQSETDLARPRQLLDWAKARAERTGVLAEQYHPDSGEPLSVSPLTWSQAEVLQLILEIEAAERRLNASE